jgi:hypothetical protein
LTPDDIRAAAAYAADMIADELTLTEPQSPKKP